MVHEDPVANKIFCGATTLFGFPGKRCGLYTKSTQQRGIQTNEMMCYVEGKQPQDTRQLTNDEYMTMLYNYIKEIRDNEELKKSSAGWDAQKIIFQKNRGINGETDNEMFFVDTIWAKFYMHLVHLAQQIRGHLRGRDIEKLQWLDDRRSDRLGHLQTVYDEQIKKRVFIGNKIKVENGIPKRMVYAREHDNTFYNKRTKERLLNRKKRQFDKSKLVSSSG